MAQDGVRTTVGIACIGLALTACGGQDPERPSALEVGGGGCHFSRSPNAVAYTFALGAAVLLLLRQRSRTSRARDA
jgi:hypothetical protein